MSMNQEILRISTKNIDFFYFSSVVDAAYSAKSYLYQFCLSVLKSDFLNTIYKFVNRRGTLSALSI